jgi:WD40 repeat protein
MLGPTVEKRSLSAPVNVFFSHAPEDELSRRELEKHLSMLERTGKIRGWSSRQIGIGEHRQRARDAKLEAAQLIVLLISADYLASDDCHDVEMARARERARAGEALVLAVLVSACDLGAEPFETLRVLPTDERPVESWPSREEAWANVAGGIREAVLQLTGDESSAPTRAFLSSLVAPWHIHFPHNPGFVGRAGDLDSLHELLQAGRGGALPVALIGMGGTGKTQLAVEYAYAHRDAYPGGVYWANAAGDDWRPALEKLAVALDLTANDAPAAERQLRLITALAEHLRARPDALVIFDNVDRPSDLLSDGRAGFLPVSLGGRLLFTTRRGVDARHFRGVELSVLTDEAALELLLSSRRPLWEARQTALVKAEIEAGYAVCRALGDLPLAVTLAAAFLAKSAKVTLAGYLGRIKKYGALPATDTNKLTEGDLATRHPAAMGATLASQWESLKTDEARLTLRAAALLDEAAEIATARLSLLTGLAEVAEEGFSVPMDEALHELKELRLVEELTETKAIRLHPLVREFVAKGIEAPEAFTSSCVGNLGEALWEMGRLNDEVAARGVDAVLDDLRIGVQLSPKGETRWIERLMRPLDREAHCLRTWKPAERPEFLLQQVRNRCFEMEEEDGCALAEAVLEGRRLGYLRERVRTSRESEALVRTLEGHTEFVSCVAVTADGRQAISGSWDDTLKVWDLGSGKLVRTLEGHTSTVNGVAVTAAGQVVSASGDKTLKVWDLGSGRLVRTLEGHTGRVNGVAVTAAGQVVSASGDRTLKIWDLGSGELVRTLEGHTQRVNGVLVTSDGQVVSASWDGTLKVWDLGSGELVRTLEGHTETVSGVAVTAAGQVVSASWDGTLKVWDLGSGELVRTLEGHTDTVSGVAVTAAGQIVSASWDGTLKVWDLGSGELVRTLEGHTDTVSGVAVTAAGQLVSASWDGTLKVWDLGSGELVRTLEGHTDTVSGVAVTAAGQVVSASLDTTLKIWDLGRGEPVRTLEGHTEGVTGVAVTAAGQVVSASWDENLKVWDLGSGELVHTLEGHTGWVSGVAVTAAGQVVSASNDKTLKVWDLGSGEFVRTLEGHTDAVSGVAVTAAGQVVSASRDKTLKIWDLGSGEVVRTLEGHSRAVTGVAVTAAGQVVSASNDKTLKVWDLGSGELVHTLEGHTHAVFGVAVTADGRWALSVSADSTLRVWDVTTCRTVALLKAHAWLRCCAIVSAHLFVAGDDGGGLHIIEWIQPPPAGPSRPAATRPVLRPAPELLPTPR